MRDEASIKIVIREGAFDSGRAITVPIGLFEAKKLFARIDFPSDDAGSSAIFCTPNAERKLLDRKQLVALISHTVAKELAEMLGAKDTRMGYPMGDD